MFLIELLFLILLLKFFEEIGLKGSCLFFGVLHVVNAISYSMGLIGIFSHFVYGLLVGVVAYFMAKFFLFVIRVLGGIGSIIVTLFFILCLLAIIL